MTAPVEPEALLSLVESVGAPILAVDRTLSPAFLNDAAESWLGRSRARVAGRPLSALDPAGPALAALAAAAIQSSEVRTALVDHAGVVQASPWWAGGKLVGAVLVVQATAATDRPGPPTDLAALAAGLAHEVRNPLAAVRGATELLTQHLAPDGAAAEYLALILRETKRVDALVGKMLDLSRPPNLRKNRVSPAEILHDLALEAHAFAKARGQEVEVVERYDPAAPRLDADRARLFEALANLVKNAVEAVPAPGGRIELTAFVEAALRRRDAGGRAHSLFRFAVRDNGPGLGSGRDRLFTPFFTTKANGTGLGLVLARRTVEAHGGMLSLKDLAPGLEAQVLLPLGISDA